MLIDLPIEMQDMILYYLDEPSLRNLNRVIPKWYPITKIINKIENDTRTYYYTMFIDNHIIPKVTDKRDNGVLGLQLDSGRWPDSLIVSVTEKIELCNNMLDNINILSQSKIIDSYKKIITTPLFV